MAKIEAPEGMLKVPDAAPRVVLPELETVFALRARRLLQLAQGHAMADYLGLMGAVVQAQHGLVARRRPPAVDEAVLNRSREFGMPPLSTLGHSRDAQWLADLDDIAAALAGVQSAAAMCTALAALDLAQREALADRVLTSTLLDGDAAAAPLVGAALQTYFTRIAAALELDVVSHCDVATVCPVCATRPVASVVRLGGERNNLRYLCCALCSTEWSLARIRCSACESENAVHFLALTQAQAAPEEDAEAAHAAAAQARRAETCDDCKSYLKIFYQEKDPTLEPMADDLASLALDVAVDEQGYARSGPNLLLHPGAG